MFWIIFLIAYYITGVIGHCFLVAEDRGEVTLGSLICGLLITWILSPILWVMWISYKHGPIYIWRRYKK